MLVAIIPANRVISDADSRPALRDRGPDNLINAALAVREIRLQLKILGIE